MAIFKDGQWYHDGPEKKKNKYELVKEHLLKRGKITSWEAITKFRATRLSDIIYKMRKRGYAVGGKWVRYNRQRYMVYTLEK